MTHEDYLRNSPTSSLQGIIGCEPYMSSGSTIQLGVWSDNVDNDDPIALIPIPIKEAAELATLILFERQVLHEPEPGY